MGSPLSKFMQPISEETFNHKDHEEHKELDEKLIWHKMGQGGGYSTTSTIRAIYGSVSFEKASNLHAGLCAANLPYSRIFRIRE